MSDAEFIWPIRVYYEDTDVAGVVYYANYLKFFERGRTEWLRALGLEQDILIEQGIAFVVRRAEIDYLKAARFNDELEVRTRVIEVRKASVRFGQILSLKNKPEYEVCRGNILVACVNMATLKPTPVPAALLEELERDV